MEEMIRIYNAGHRHPAEVTQRTDTGVVIRCRVIKTPDDLFAIRTVTVSANLIEAELAIRCLIQSWRPPVGTQPLTIDCETPIEFTANGARLCFDKKLFTAIQAAEKVLSEALLNWVRLL